MYPCDANWSMFIVPAIIIGGLICGCMIFAFVYNSSAMAELTCADLHANFGFPTRVILTPESPAVCEVFVDNNWVNICDSGIGFYCTAVN